MHKFLIRSITGSLYLCLLLNLALMVPTAAAAKGYSKPYNALLHQYVKAGKKAGITAMLVNYRRWGKDSRHAQALKALQATNVAALGSKKATMVFWINAYNLLTVDLIVRNPQVKSIKDLGSFLSSPWKAHSWKIAGKSYTLDDIEHKILRKMGDPRIHMAIVCASLSCPDLRNEVYTAKRLNKQLNDQARTFLGNSTKGMRRTASGLTLSPIFKWFAEDFGGKRGILTFVSHHTSQLPANVGIDSYFSYNWNLNKP